MLRNDEPYAVIALDEHNFGPHTRYEMSISLTLAFLLSARLPFHFPMSDDVSRDVDRAFNKVFKDLPMESKRIAYRKDLPRDGKIRLLDGAKLVITSDPQIQERVDAETIPNIFLDFKSGRPPFISWRLLENLEDDILKRQIIVYSKLINTARNAAQSIGMLDRLGTIEQRKIADLILPEANPSKNSENTMRIGAVKAGSKNLPNEALKEMLADAEPVIANQGRH